MSIIAFANPKGGSGKTTSALILAQEFARAGTSVTLIDADPERWITKWSQLAEIPANIDVVSDVSEDNIIDAVLDAHDRSRVVIVDLEGTANMAVVQAIGIADLVIVPSQGATMDSQGAAKIIKLICQQARALRREVPHCVLFTRTSAAIETRALRHTREEMIAAGVPTLTTSLVERAAFRELLAFGGDLHDLDPREVSGIEKAAANAEAYGQEVRSILASQAQEAAE